MKRTYTLLSLILALITLPLSSRAQYGEAISPASYQEMLGRGYDVDWWTNNEMLDDATFEQAIVDFANAGVRHVRIRINKPVLSSYDFDILDRQVQLCLSYNIIPIIAYEPAYYDNPGRVVLRARIGEWWGAMAAHYRYMPARLSFDILWEPSHSMFSSYAYLNAVYDDCVTIIRRTNPYRIIFLSPGYGGDPMYLRYLRIPSRGAGYVMAEWHFCTYGDSYRMWETWRDRPSYGRQWARRRIRAALDWQRRTGIRTWVGGWMPGDAYYGARYAGSDYTDYMCSALHRAGIPFAIGGARQMYDYRAGNWRPSSRQTMETVFTGRGNSFNRPGGNGRTYDRNATAFARNRRDNVRFGGQGRSDMDGNRIGSDRADRNRQDANRGQGLNRRGQMPSDGQLRRPDNDRRTDGPRTTTVVNDNSRSDNGRPIRAITGNQQDQRGGTVQLPQPTRNSGGGFSRGNSGSWSRTGQSSSANRQTSTVQRPSVITGDCSSTSRSQYRGSERQISGNVNGSRTTMRPIQPSAGQRQWGTSSNYPSQHQSSTVPSRSADGPSRMPTIQPTRPRQATVSRVSTPSITQRSSSSTPSSTTRQRGGFSRTAR